MSKLTERVQKCGSHNICNDCSVYDITLKSAKRAIAVLKEEIIIKIMNRPEYAGENRLTSETLLIAKIIDDIEGIE